MISELRIDNPDTTCIPWWPQVKWLKGRSSIEFKPGLNILWGPNGSGKTSILLCLARMLHAEAGNSTVVTSNSLREVFGFSNGEGPNYLNGAVPIHDGNAVMHFDPTHAVGLAHGGAAFDWDFGMAGIANTMFKGSAGQTTLNRIGEVLEALVRGQWPDVVWHNQVQKPTTKKRPKDLWAQRAWLVGETLKGTIPIGPRTILLDEPDRSLDLPYQWGLWSRIAEEKGVQIIAASHSLVALGLEGANYIELGDGDYLRKSELVLDRIAERHVMSIEGIPKTAKADMLKAFIKRMAPSTGKSRRDPRIDPAVGDIVRVTRTDGTYQFRKVTQRVTTPTGRLKVRWRYADTEKGGSMVVLGTWQKVCKDAMVVRTLPKIPYGQVGSSIGDTVAPARSFCRAAHNGDDSLRADLNRGGGD